MVQAIDQAAARGSTGGRRSLRRAGTKIETLRRRKQLTQRTGFRRKKGSTYFSRKLRRRERQAVFPPQSAH
jgi:hypothetical protein